jgi:hypothetical protein
MGNVFVHAVGAGAYLTMTSYICRNNFAVGGSAFYVLYCNEQCILHMDGNYTNNGAMVCGGGIGVGHMTRAVLNAVCKVSSKCTPFQGVHLFGLKLAT